jgi:repressor LexA
VRVMREGLHPSRLKILEYLVRTKRGGEETPSEREIGRAVGLKSSQTVHHHLKALEAEGYVERTSSGGHKGRTTKRRPIRITPRGWGAVGTAPLLGRIAAGRGLEAVADEEAYSLAADLLGSRSGRRRYVLRVVGDSMVDARISDGDLLVVEEDEEPEDGAVVVALIGDGEEVTVKKLYREGESVRLRPQNDGHEDIVVPARDVVVQGRAVGVIHPFGRGL